MPVHSKLTANTLQQLQHHAILCTGQTFHKHVHSIHCILYYLRIDMSNPSKSFEETPEKAGPSDVQQPQQ